MDKFLGVLQSDAEAGMEANRSGKQSKLDQMLQAQMLADIMRANNNLKALKNFRVNNGKFYRDKALEAARRKEIREPLDNALNEIDLLNSKVERRDEMILVLRRQLYTEILRNMQGISGSKSNNSGNDPIHDMQAAEELKVLNLEDQADRLKQLILAQQQQITKVKRSLAFQISRVKELYSEIEALQFAHADHVRKSESDKEIYMGMVDSRDTKIEKLMDEREDLQERLAEAEELISTLQHQGELKKAKQRCTDLESKLKEAEEVMSIQREQFASLDVAHQQLLEENAVMKDKQEDLQARYDTLIVELDQMVEEGYYIPSANDIQQLQQLQQAQNNMRSTIEQQSSDAQVSSANVKKKNSKNYSRKHSVKKQKSSLHPSKQRSLLNINSLTINEDLTNNDNDNGSVSSLESNLQEQDNTGNYSQSHNNSATSATSLLQPPSESSDINNATPAVRTGRFALRRQEEEQLLAERLQANAALRQKDTLLAQINSLQQDIAKQKQLRQEEMSKAALAQEGLQLGQRILTGEINRMGSKMEEMESKKKELLEEIQLLKTTNNLLQQQVSNLYSRDDPSGDGMVFGRKKSSIYQRLSQMVIPRPDPADIIAEAALRAEFRVEAQEEQAKKEEARLQKEKLAREKLLLEEEEKRKAEEELKLKQQQEVDEGLKVDMLQYMYAWENVYENSIETQTMVITESVAVQVEKDLPQTLPTLFYEDSQAEENQKNENNDFSQVDESKEQSQAVTEEAHEQTRHDNNIDDHDYESESDYEDNHHEQHHDNYHKHQKRKSRRSHRETERSRRSTRRNDTSLAHLTPAQLLLINRPFEELFQGLSLTIASFLPPNKMQLLYPSSTSHPYSNSNLDSQHETNKDWKQQLPIEEVIAGLDIEWQVKHGLALLAAINELRNAFVRSHLPSSSSSNTANNHTNPEQNDSSLLWYEQLPPGVAPSVRCLDIILQSLHHLLSPLMHLQRSTHPELLHLMLPVANMESKMHVIRKRMFPPDLESRKPFQNTHLLGKVAVGNNMEETYVRIDSNEENKQDEEDIYLALSSAIKASNSPAFPLTEPRLSADFVRGAPRGALSPDHTFTTRNNSRKGGMSMLPRKFPRHVDQLLDLIEKEARAKSSRSNSPEIRPIATTAAVPSSTQNSFLQPSGTDSSQQGQQEQQLFGGLSLVSEGIIKEYRHSLTLDPPPHMTDSIHFDENEHDHSSLASSSNVVNNSTFNFRSSSPQQPPSVDSGVVRHLLAADQEEMERNKRATVSFTIDGSFNNDTNEAVSDNKVEEAAQEQKGLRRGSPAHYEQSLRRRLLWPPQHSNNTIERDLEFVDYKRLLFDPNSAPSLTHLRSAHGSRPITSQQQARQQGDGSSSRPRTSINTSRNSNRAQQQSQQVQSESKPQSRGVRPATSSTIQPWRRSEMTHQSLLNQSHGYVNASNNNNEAEDLLLQAKGVPRGQSAPQSSTDPPNANYRQRSQSPPRKPTAPTHSLQNVVFDQLLSQQDQEQQQQSTSLVQMSASLMMSSSLKASRVHSGGDDIQDQLSVASQPMQPVLRPAFAATASNNFNKGNKPAVMTVTINQSIPPQQITTEPKDPTILLQQQEQQKPMSPSSHHQLSKVSVPAPLPPRPETSAAREMLVRYLAHTQRELHKANGLDLSVDYSGGNQKEHQVRSSKAGTASQQTSPRRQPSRPPIAAASPPVTKFYSPRVARHLLLPGTGKEVLPDFTSQFTGTSTAEEKKAAVDLRDTAVMLNALDDRRIFPSIDRNGGQNSTLTKGVEDRPEQGLVILGNRSKPAANREKVTGSFLFM